VKAVIFARVSSLEQATEGGSIEGQRKACERLAEREGYEVATTVIAPGESGYKDRRPSLGELREAVLRTGAKVVLVLRANRLARNWTVAAEIVREFARQGVTIRSVMENGINSGTKLGDAELGEAIARGQRESAEKALLAIDQQRGYAAAGRWQWRAPYGYKTNGRRTPSLLIDDERAQAIQALFTAVDNGERRTEAFRRLQRAGRIPPAAGRTTPVVEQTAFTWLQNSAYMGRIVTKDLDLKGDFVPLIGEDLFHRVQRKLQTLLKTRQPRSYQRVRPDLPLRGLVTCPHCKRPITASWSTGKSGQRFAYFHCTAKGRTPICPRVPRQVFETAFLEALGALRPDRRTLERCCSSFKAYVAQEASKRAGERTELGARRRRIEARRETLDEQLLDGTMQKDRYRKSDETLRRELAEVEHDLRLIEANPLPDLEELMTFTRELLSHLPAVFVAATPTQKAQLRRILFESVTFDNGKIRTQPKGRFFKQLTASTGEELKVGTGTGIRTPVPWLRTTCPDP
jgi:site-specific DNA recombinase